MTKLELDINEILDFDGLSDSIIENLSEDIHKANPEWWAEKVCKPMQKELKKLLEDRELMRDSISQLLIDYVGYDYIRNVVDDTISRQIKAVVREKLQDFDVTITRRLTDYNDWWRNVTSINSH